MMMNMFGGLGAGAGGLSLPNVPNGKYFSLNPDILYTYVLPSLP